MRRAVLAGVAGLAFLLPALAAEPAFYHPDDVAKASALFGQAAEAMGPSFEDRQGKLTKVGDALADLELGVALLGADAPAPLKDWSEKTRRKVLGEKVRLQKHVDLLQDDYGRVFGDAVQRALPTVGKGYDVKVCGATGVVAMMGKKNCSGVDLNGKLAAAIDQDATLKKELASIASVEWPSFEAPSAAQPVVALTGTTRWVAGGKVADTLIGARVKSKRDALEGEIERVLGDEPTEADVQKAQGLKDAYLAELGKDGQVLRTAITGALGRAAKKGGPAEVGWCANPASLGGCPGEDVTKAVLDTLAADKKFAREIGGLTGE